jgi:trigger factor
MKVEVRKEAPSKAVLEVELPPEELGRGLDRAIIKLNQRVSVPGFRRGKAPRTLLERVVGKEALYEEAINQLVPDAYSQAVDQAGVRPIARPQIDVKEVEEGKPLRFVATVDLVPEVRLGDYRAIRIPPREPKVETANVEAAITDLRSRHARLVPTGDQPAEEGAFVLIKTVDVQGSLERLLPGKEYLVEIGGGTFPAELERALIGAKVGSSITVTLEPAGSTATVTVVDIKRRELPELTNEFAKQAAGTDSIEELRKALQERLMTEAAAQAERDYQQQVVDALLGGATIELPASMVDHEVEHLIADLSASLERRGMTLTRYLEAAKKTQEQLAEEVRPNAERRLRTQLALNEVARLEGLAPSQEEIDREAEKLAQSLQQDLPRVREWLAQEGRQDALIASLRRQKTLAYLVTSARGGSQ